MKEKYFLLKKKNRKTAVFAGKINIITFANNRKQNDDFIHKNNQHFDTFFYIRLFSRIRLFVVKNPKISTCFVSTKLRRKVAQNFI